MELIPILQVGDTRLKLRRIRQQLAPREFRTVIEFIGREVGVAGESRFSPYPVRPKSPAKGRRRKQYRRTGTLGRSENSTVFWEGDTLVVSWGSNVDYAVWVRGMEQPPEGVKGQAWMHIGIWTPMDEDVLNESVLQQYDGIIERRLDIVIETLLR